MKKIQKKLGEQGKEILRQFNKTKQLVKHFEMLILGMSLLIFFLLFELTLRIHNLYKFAYWVDVPSHFFAGIAFASLFYVLLCLTGIKSRNMFSIIFVAIAAVLWELLEMLGDAIIPQPAYMLDFFIWDGFWDIIITIAGGVTFLVLFNRYVRKRLGVALGVIK